MAGVIAAIGLAGQADAWNEGAKLGEEEARLEREIRLDELMGLEKLPPEELKRQMDAAAAILLKEQSCPPPL